MLVGKTDNSMSVLLVFPLQIPLVYLSKKVTVIEVI